MIGKQQTAWIIGGSSGLGFASAKALGESGSRLIVSARPGDRLDRAVEQLQTVTNVTPLPLDLTDHDAVAAAISAVGAEVDVVVLSGGGPPPSRAAELTVDQLDDAYRLMLRPAALVIAGMGLAMAAQGGGVICIVTSSGVRDPIPGLATSNMMRAAITSMAKTAATELSSSGVRIVCVAPGRIDTERVGALDLAAANRSGRSADDVRSSSEASIPAGRYGEPHEFGQVVRFVCSPEASYLTGTTISVDGGKATGLLS